MDIIEFRSSLEAVVLFYKRHMTGDLSEFSKKKRRMKLPIIPMKLAFQIIKETSNIFTREPSLYNITGDYIIVGNLDGRILDLYRILDTHGFPPKSNYIFNGNIIGDGDTTIETLLLVYILKCLFPANVYVLRGKNEFEENCKESRLMEMMRILYETDQLFKPIMISFSVIPFAAVLNQKILCVSGGIGPDITNLNVIGAIQRPVVKLNSLILQLVESDPIESLPMFLPHTDSRGYFFGAQSLHRLLLTCSLDLMIRSCPLSECGSTLLFADELISISSGSNELCRSGIVIIKDMEPKTVSYDGFGHVNKTEIHFIPSLHEDSFVSAEIQTLSPRLSATTRALNVSGFLVSNRDGYRVPTMKNIPPAQTTLAARMPPSLKQLKRPTIKVPKITNSDNYKINKILLV